MRSDHVGGVHLGRGIVSLGPLEDTAVIDVWPIQEDTALARRYGVLVWSSITRVSGGRW